MGAVLTGPLSSPARLIQHTKDLMESEEKLCVKVLRTLQQMLLKKTKYGDRVSAQAGWMPAGLARSSRGSAPGLAGQWLHGETYQWGLAPSSPGQPAAQDATAKLPPEPEVQLAGGPPGPCGHWSVPPPPPCLWAAHWPRTKALPPAAPPHTSPLRESPSSRPGPRLVSNCSHPVPTGQGGGHQAGV